MPTEREDAWSKGAELKSLGAALVVLGVLGAALLGIVSLSSEAIPQPLAPLWAAVFVVSGLAVYRRGRRYLATAASAPAASDARPPVVYLRSFRADALTSMPVTSPPLAGPLALLHPIEAWSRMFDFFDTRTEEELLVDVLRRVGPVIAIGKPGEKLPELGAARTYVDDAEWQETVGALFARAGMAVLRIGRTAGVHWELEQAVKTLEPTQLVLLVASSRKEYEAFRQHASAQVPRGLPKYEASLARRMLGGRHTGSLKGLVYFTRDWTPVYVDLAQVRWPRRYTLRFLGRRTIINVLEWALHPVFDQRGVQWAPPAARWLLIVLKLVPAVLFTTVVLAALGMGAYIVLTH